VLALEHPGQAPDSPCTIELISSLDELTHNETYKCYEIKEDLVQQDQSEGRDLGNGDRGIRVKGTSSSRDKDEALSENEEGDLSDSKESLEF
jgi:hypothetical protein